MKKIIFILSFLFFISNLSIHAQFLEKVAKKAEKKVEREAEKRSEKRVNKGIDKVFDKTEEEIDDAVKGNPDEKKNTDNKKNKKVKNTNENKNEEGTNKTTEEGVNNSSSDSDANTESTETNTDKPKPPTVVWSRYDFVPGDEVIFEDAPAADEENGEFPSRWDLVEGNCEIIEVNGEKVIAFPKGGMIVPYLKNAKDDYLPEVFTIEFDAWLWHDNQRDIYVKWYDKKNQRNSLNNNLEVNSYSMETSGTYQELESKSKHNGKWRHISIAYTRGKLKSYLDDTRLINIPHYEGNPSGLTIGCRGYSEDTPEKLQYIKNIRIAKGGVKYYDRILSEGKIIVNGIKFDINKATLKPESMGPINNIFEMMQKNPDLKFSVEGHTDSDGADAANQTLSDARAKTVMNQLISMGIAADRLKSAGWGESKPIAGNDTPEGKANNRRVEFVKF